MLNTENKVVKKAKWSLEVEGLGTGWMTKSLDRSLAKNRE